MEIYNLQYVLIIPEVCWTLGPYGKYDCVVSVARFLESRGMIEEALEVATDPDYRFELAIQLGKLEIAKVSVVNRKC